MRVSVSSGKHLSTWVGQTIHVYSVIFIAIYLLCSSPLQKYVLTLDDVMLQVQRIYVNRGSRVFFFFFFGGGKGGWVMGCQGSKVARHYKIYLLTKWKSYYATFEGLYRSTGRPDVRRVEPLMILALPLKERRWARTTLWSKSYFSVIKKKKILDLLWYSVLINNNKKNEK